MFFYLGDAVARRQELHKDGIRRTITFRPDLDEKLAVEAARRRVPISVILEELIEHSFRSPKSPEDLAREFPLDWDGADLRSRLAHLQMRQLDLANLLNVPSRTLNPWVTGVTHFPPGELCRIQEVLKAWVPGSNPKFRLGSRSPNY